MQAQEEQTKSALSCVSPRTYGLMCVHTPTPSNPQKAISCSLLPMASEHNRGWRIANDWMYNLVQVAL